MKPAPQPLAVFFIGAAATGKTTVCRLVLPRLVARTNEPWCILDKDRAGEHLGRALLSALGVSPDDRDSPVYKTHVRDAEYASVLSIAAENLRLGVNCLLPAPFTRELNDGRLFNPQALGFADKVRTRVVHLSATAESRYARILERAHPQDVYKLKHWDQFREDKPTGFENDPRVLHLRPEHRTTQRGLTPEAWALLMDHLDLVEAVER